MDFHQTFTVLPSIQRVFRKQYNLLPYKDDWMIGKDEEDGKTFIILQSPNIDIYDALRYVHRFAEERDKSFDKGCFSPNQEPLTKVKFLHPNLSSETIITANTNCRVLVDKIK